MSHTIQSVEHVLDMLPCGALVLRPDGQVVFANTAMHELVGATPRSLCGANLRALYATGDVRVGVDRLLSRLGEETELEFVLPRGGGKLGTALLTVRRIAEQPGLSDCYMIAARDVSRQRATERELRESFDTVARLSDTVIAQALSLKSYSETLEQQVQERTRELHEANMEAIYMLAEASEARDADTGAHVRRIERYSLMLARASGMPPREAERIGYSAILHDVGKILVPDEILKKPAELTSDERALMQSHTLAGERILSRKPFFDLARRIARSHHENWDGSGYPDGIAGDAIPLDARIVHVVDVFDALASSRVYKSAWTPERAIEEIRSQAGQMFDPRLVEEFAVLFYAGALDAILSLTAYPPLIHAP